MNEKAESFTDHVGTSNTLSEKLNKNKLEQICFELDRANPQPIALIFKQTDDIQDSFKYMQLMGERYMPNKGIILFYSQATITIAGLQLGLLFKELTQQKISLIKIYDVPYQVDKLEKNVAIVKSITVEYHDKSIETLFTKLEDENFTRNGHANDEQKSEGS